MSKGRRHFHRPLGDRRYRKLFVLAVEGARTEHQYFAVFNMDRSVISVQCLKGKHESSPSQVLKRMEAYLRQKSIRKSDEAWLVVDKDQWHDGQLRELYEWSLKSDNYGFALSNPQFEYWMLLHFEKGAGISSSRDCTERLRRYLPDYDKHLDMRRISTENIHDAISRAKIRDNPPCKKWPRRIGNTTVYRLVERLVSSA